MVSLVKKRISGLPIYRLVMAGTELELSNNITRLLRQGFMPLGGPFIDPDGYLYQAVIYFKDEDEEPDK